MNKKKDSAQEGNPRKPKKEERKLLFFERFRKLDWKPFVPLKNKKEIGEN